MIVIDASVVVHTIIEGQKAEKFIDDISTYGAFYAPELIYLEVLNAIRHHLNLKKLNAEQAENALLDLQNFPLTLQPVHHQLQRIWALRNNITPNDAAYVALAEAQNLPLLTRDKKLAQAVASHTQVILI